jgi:probable phosphoglycerate mutase
MRLYFVRHGESEANTLGMFSNRGYKYGLTENGKAQAMRLAQNLKNTAISRMFSSPLRRAVETAEILSKTLGVTYKVTDALREYDCGVLEEQAYSEANWAIYNEVLSAWVSHGQWDRSIEGGESFRDMKERFAPFVERLSRTYQHNPENLLLVGHGGLYRCMLPPVFVNIDFQFALAHPISNTAYIVAELRPEGLRCLRWCEVDTSGTTYSVFARG